MLDRDGVRIEDMSGAWVESYRENARFKLKSLSVPSSKDENYRFSSLKSLAWDRAPRVVESLGAIDSKCLSLANGELGVVAWRSGQKPGALAEILTTPQLKELVSQGLVFSDANRILKDPDARIVGAMKAHWKLPTVFGEDIWAQHVAANWQNAIVVYVPAQMKVPGILRGLHWFDENSETMLSRTVIIADEGSQCHYIDEFAGSSSDKALQDNSVALGLIEIYAAPYAQVQYSQLQHLSSRCHYVFRQNLCAQAGARIEYVPLICGGNKGQIRSEGFCNGSGSAIQTTGAVRGRTEEQFDFWSTTTHDVAHTESGLDYWTVVDGKSKAVFNGKIVITERGNQTEAYQKNRNMLLSKQAEVVTLPKLEIATDDVKCAHGASVASVQEDQLYYLQSRGIALRDAQEMIIRGFTGPVIAKLPEGDLRDRADYYMNGLDPLKSNGEDSLW